MVAENKLKYALPKVVLDQPYLGPFDDQGPNLGLNMA